MFERPYIQQLIERWESSWNIITVLDGARQVGKTTMVAEQAAKRYREKYDKVYCEYVLFRDNPKLEIHSEVSSTDNKSRLERVWENARQKARVLAENLAKNKKPRKNFILILDEIQKVPDWAGVVKGLLDTDLREGINLQVTVLGSAPLLLMSGLSDSLAGRFIKLNLPHWSYAEMSEAFGWALDDYLFFGGYPVSGKENLDKHPQEWKKYILEAMIDPYINTDIKAVAPRLQKPALLRNLFMLGSQYAGQILSYNKMLGQMHDAGNTTTLANYLGHLENCGLMVGLQQFTGWLSVRATSPKLLALNNAFMGVYCGYATKEEAIADRTFRGRLAENAVGAHFFQTKPIDANLYYWRQNGDEIDYILHWEQRIYAVEVKSGRQKAHGAGFNKFKERFHKHERIKKIKNIVIGNDDLTLAEFLGRPASKWMKEWRHE